MSFLEVKDQKEKYDKIIIYLKNNNFITFFSMYNIPYF
jgi:hypothetical protein